jgi:hypothetical protein
MSSFIICLWSLFGLGAGVDDVSRCLLAWLCIVTSFCHFVIRFNISKPIIIMAIIPW